MKREGRQHGSVRTIPHQPYTDLHQKYQKNNPNNLPPATAGFLKRVFTRVTNKPTNHSKFTGKCGGGRGGCGSRCHLHPVWRSKNKIKGTHKLRSSNMAMDYNVGNNHRRLGLNKLKLDGYSASRILDELTSSDGYYYSHLDYANDEDDYPHYGEDQRLNTCYDYNDDRPNGDEYYEDDESTPPPARIELMGMSVIPMSISYDGDFGGDRIEEFVLDDTTTITITTTTTSDEDDEDDDEDEMGGFFDVAIVWETIDGDEGWSIVGEI